MLLAGCQIAPADWGFSAIRTMVTPADPPLECGQAIADDHRAERAACTFKAGSHPSESLGISAAVGASIPIRHVVLVMLENRSYDMLLGRLHDQGQPEAEAIPADYTNPDLDGVKVAPFHATTTCLDLDPAHQSASMKIGVNGGAMDGWVKNAAQSSTNPAGDDTKTDGHYVMSTYERSDLPFYYWLADTYALSDRHFASMVSGTFGNRNFYLFGWNADIVDTGI